MWKRSFVFGFLCILIVSLNTPLSFAEEKAELTKIQGEIQTQNGMKRSYDKVITKLIEFWRANH